MIKILCFLKLILITSICCAQQTELAWLNENSISLKSYQKKLKTDLKGVEVLMLGEASHGTKEFFLEKNEIIKYLISNDGYTQIGFEHMDTEIQKINDYISSDKDQDLPKAMENLMAYKTQEFAELFQWLRSYNIKNPNHKVAVFGFHKEGFYDPFTRDQLMSEEVVKVKDATNAKIILWAHNIHTARNKTMPEISAMGDYLSQTYTDKFFNIAFDTYEGDVHTMNWSNENGYTFDIKTLPPVDKDSFTSIFNQVKHPNFYVHFSKGNPFVSQTRKITNIMVNWKAPFALPTTIAEDFNALIFIRKTSASDVIK